MMTITARILCFLSTSKVWFTDLGDSLATAYEITLDARCFAAVACLRGDALRNNCLLWNAHEVILSGRILPSASVRTWIFRR